MSSDRSKNGYDDVIEMAGTDRVCFEAQLDVTGLSQSDVIDVMRRKLKPSSFRRWRRRVGGRRTKHRDLCAVSSHC